VGVKVLVVFSIQSAARYHDPAFIPVREASVVDSSGSGDLRFVRFELGDYTSLSVPVADSERWPADLESAVKWFTGVLKAGGQCPYAYSAALVNDPLVDHRERFAKGPDVVAFGSVARYLAQTQSFKRARFFACQRLMSAGHDASHVTATEGVFELGAGSSYEVVIMHSQPGSVEDVSPFLVSADDDLVRVIGRPGFDIASNYDIVRIPIHIADPGQVEESVLAIRPDALVQGPSMSLRLRIIPKNRLGAALATATFILLTAIVGFIPTSSKDVNTDFLWFKGVIAVLATTVAFLPVLSRGNIRSASQQQS